MSQHIINLERMNSWVLPQLQPEKHDNYPLVRDSMHLAKDQSLLQVNATVTGFLCSNSRNQQDRHRHYWVVEFEIRSLWLKSPLWFKRLISEFLRWTGRCCLYPLDFSYCCCCWLGTVSLTINQSFLQLKRQESIWGFRYKWLDSHSYGAMWHLCCKHSEDVFLCMPNITDFWFIE